LRQKLSQEQANMSMMSKLIAGKTVRSETPGSLCAAMMLVVALGGCSSKQQEEEDVAASQQASETTSENEKEGGDGTAAESTAETDTEKGTEIAEAPTGNADAVAAEPAPAEAAPQAVVPVVTGDGEASVQYVKSKNCPLVDAPGGKVVGKLTRGEHLLVWTEGEWSKTSDGHYVATKHLSKKGVARVRTPATWKSGIAH